MAIEKKDIVLIHPNHREWAGVLPLGIAYLAAVLKNSGFSLGVIDAQALNLSTEEVSKKALGYSPKIVGISCSTVQVKAAWEIAQKIKEVSPKIFIVLGGVHPTALPEESLEKETVDFVLRAEAEYSFLELVEALLNKKDITHIEGLSYKREGAIQHNPKKNLILDLDLLPFPARELFPFPYAYRSPYTQSRYFATLLSSRGCPGGCIFCNKNIFGFKFRRRSPENVLDEIDYLYKEFNISEFHFADDCFSLDRLRVERICDLIIHKKLKIRWACSNGIRVDTIDYELLRKMREAGCYRIALGVESGSERILQAIGKATSREKISQAFKDCRRAGIITVGFFMLGNYGEDEETMLETIRFAKALNPDYAQFAIAVPYPGTTYYDIIKKEGRFISQDWSDYGIFDHQVVFEIGRLSPELLLRMYRRAYQEFYLDPLRILRIIKQRLPGLKLETIKQMWAAFIEVTKRMRVGKR